MLCLVLTLLLNVVLVFASEGETSDHDGGRSLRTGHALLAPRIAPRARSRHAPWHASTSHAPVDHSLNVNMGPLNIIRERGKGPLEVDGFSRRALRQQRNKGRRNRKPPGKRERGRHGEGSDSIHRAVKSHRVNRTGKGPARERGGHAERSDSMHREVKSQKIFRTGTEKGIAVTESVGSGASGGNGGQGQIGSREEGVADKGESGSEGTSDYGYGDSDEATLAQIKSLKDKKSIPGFNDENSAAVIGPLGEGGVIANGVDEVGKLDTLVKGMPEDRPANAIMRKNRTIDVAAVDGGKKRTRANIAEMSFSEKTTYPEGFGNPLAASFQTSGAPSVGILLKDSDGIESLEDGARHNSSDGFVGREELRQLSHRLAKDGVVIMLVCNYGYHDFFLNWVMYAKDWGLDKHFIAIAEDAPSLAFLEERWPGQGIRLHVPQIESAPDTTSLKYAGLDSLNTNESTSSASAINSPEFKLIMYRRLFYLRMLMESGVDVLLCDVDIIFLKDPFPYFTGDYDIYGTIEKRDKTHYKVPTTGPMNRKGSMFLCGGFLLFRNTPLGWLVLDHLLLNVFRTTVTDGEENDQMYLRNVLMNLWGFWPRPRVGVLPQQKFPPGWLYFGQSKWRAKNAHKVVIVHNNWIRFKPCKMLRWLLLGLWRVPGLSTTADYMGFLRKQTGRRKKKLLDWSAMGVPDGVLPSNMSLCGTGDGNIVFRAVKRPEKVKSSSVTKSRKKGESVPLAEPQEEALALPDLIGSEDDKQVSTMGSGGSKRDQDNRRKDIRPKKKKKRDRGAKSSRSQI